MTTENFFYWLQGFFELSGTTNLNTEQVQIIKDHMALVASKVTPERKLFHEEQVEADPTQVVRHEDPFKDFKPKDIIYSPRTTKKKFCAR